VGALLLVLLAPSAGAAATAPAVKLPTTKQCAVSVMGTNADGSFITTPMTCTTGATTSGTMTALSGAIATHWTGYNLTGSSLTIYGTTCSGGWLNFPAGWSYAIASTNSSCWVDHYTGANLTGASDWTWSTVRRNLASYPWATVSAQYS
jgi:hypothetical protein